MRCKQNCINHTTNLTCSARTLTYIVILQNRTEQNTFYFKRVHSTVFNTDIYNM